jgi:hypothetical protein
VEPKNPPGSSRSRAKRGGDDRAQRGQSHRVRQFAVTLLHPRHGHLSIFEHLTTIFELFCRLGERRGLPDRA